MRKIVVQTFVTLDSVMQAPGGPKEDPSNGFTQGGWSVGYWDETMNQVMGEFMSQPSDMLIGRATYDIFAAYWPKSQEPGAKEMNESKKYVVSNQDMKLTWQNSELITGDVVEKLKTLKNSEGPELRVIGSSNLIQTLLKSQLVDEFFLWVFPVVIGSGKRLFGEGTKPEGFELTWSKISESGVFMGRYTTGQKIKAGSF